MNEEMNTTSENADIKVSKIESIKKRFTALPRSKKIQVVVAACISAVMAVGLPVLAWFSYQRQTATVIPINAPTTINIKSGNIEPVEMIDLSNINVEEIIDNGEGGESLKTYGEYVFCVTGKYLSYYDIQIARTTNIDFEYELYRVESGDPYSNVISTGITTEPSVGSGYDIAEYESEIDGITYYYPYRTGTSSVIDSSNPKKYGNITDQGSYINPGTKTVVVGTNEQGEDVAVTQIIGNGAVNDANGKSFYQRNYGDTVTDENTGETRIATYTHVNEYAQPLYWQIKNVPVAGNLGDDGFVDYYVLKINWEDKGLSNNKETDMIYITARKSIS